MGGWLRLGEGAVLGDWVGTDVGNTEGSDDGPFDDSWVGLLEVWDVVVKVGLLDSNSEG